MHTHTHKCKFYHSHTPPSSFLTLNSCLCDSHQHCWAAGAPGAHGASGEVVPVSFPRGEERLSGQETLQPHPGRSLLLPLGPAKRRRGDGPSPSETSVPPQLALIMCQRFFLRSCLTWTSPTFLQETVSDGPVPWSSANSVRFVAEQVSHHPPSMCHFSSLVTRDINGPNV